MVYVLDTNMIIHYLRKTPSVYQNFIDAVKRGDSLIIPQIVNYEIKRGFRIQSAPQKEETYKVLTEPKGYCEILKMDAYSWVHAEQIYEELYKKRLTIGELDILIAAFCLENNYTLVTDNIKHFKNIDGLSFANWTE